MIKTVVKYKHMSKGLLDDFHFEIIKIQTGTVSDFYDVWYLDEIKEN